jgi:flagellin-like protein
MDPRRPSPGISPVIATMLLVGMTVVLSALVYLLLANAPQAGIDPSRLQYIHITKILHDGDPFTTTCDDSCVLLLHEGNAPLENDALSALILKNGQPMKVNITTLNGDKAVKTIHTGFRRLGGPGSRGVNWDPGEELWIDLNDGSIQGGDFITVRIIDKVSGLVISADTIRA